MKKVSIASPVQTITGPHGIKLKLDAGQIYPDDPGMGTPILFEFRGETMTWTCGYEGGNLGEILPSEQHADTILKWAADISESVNIWETHHWTQVQGAQPKS